MSKENTRKRRNSKNNFKKVQLKKILFISFYFLSAVAFANEDLLSTEDNRPLWRYGVGAGYVQFEQYPASSQYTNLFLPVPMFQYLGRVIRADDRDGTRAFIFKNKAASLEFTGGGYAACDSSRNDARRGMNDLPWVVHIGPQIVNYFTDSLSLRTAFYQAISTDFQLTKFTGGVLESTLVYEWFSEVKAFSGFESGYLTSRLSLTVKGGSKDFLSIYYEVPPSFATADRPAFDAKPGFLSSDITFIQKFQTGKTAFYYGLDILDYSLSANRQSPLHKSNDSFNFFMGITYVLGESKARSVPEDEVKGLIHN